MLVALRDEERIPALHVDHTSSPHYSHNLHHQGGNKATQLQSPSTVMVLRLMLRTHFVTYAKHFATSPCHVQLKR